jgi:glucan-binding YG repeat protein
MNFTYFTKSLAFEAAREQLDEFIVNGEYKPPFSKKEVEEFYQRHDKVITKLRRNNALVTTNVFGIAKSPEKTKKFLAGLYKPTGSDEDFEYGFQMQRAASYYKRHK